MNENECGPGECENDPTYEEPYVVPALPKDEEDGEHDDGGGGGGGASYTLPVASASTLGGVKSKDKAYYIVVDANGFMMLANAEGLAHDLDNYHKLAAVVGQVSDDDVKKLKALPGIKVIGDGLLLTTDGTLKVNGAKDSRLTDMGAKRANNLPIAVGTGFDDTTYNTDKIILHMATSDLASGGVATQELAVNGAEAAGEGKTGKAGLMTAFQATQLAGLAAAFEAEEKGVTLYSGAASVNSVTLSEDGSNFDHLTVVGEYMGMGSAAIEQSVSVDFYVTTNTRAFQMNATDITVGDTPMETTIQDIWMLSDDGLDLDLVSATKCEKGATTFTCTPETTSNFTITKVIGFGKIA